MEHAIKMRSAYPPLLSVAMGILRAASSAMVERAATAIAPSRVRGRSVARLLVCVTVQNHAVGAQGAAL